MGPETTRLPPTFANLFHPTPSERINQLYLVGGFNSLNPVDEKGSLFSFGVVGREGKVTFRLPRPVVENIIQDEDSGLKKGILKNFRDKNESQFSRLNHWTSSVEFMFCVFQTRLCSFRVHELTLTSSI